MSRADSEQRGLRGTIGATPASRIAWKAVVDGARNRKGSRMQSSSLIVPTCAALVCAFVPAAATAHHSFAAVFEMDKVTEIQGRVTQVHWINPHITIDVAASDGQSWVVEAGPVNLLTRMGIEKSMIEVG